MTHQETIPPARLTNWVREWVSTQKLPQPFLLDRLAGDGSTRCFYRLTWPALQGSSGGTRIVLFDPDWILSKDYPAHQAYLTSCGIPVPRFFTVDPPAGALVMEDFGDVLLQSHLLAFPAERSGWMIEATRLLARLHGRTFPVPPELPISSRKFDAQKYSDELAFTFEHLHQKLLKLPPPSDKAKSIVAAYCAQIEKIEPLVFAHRDYHTRNLLYKEGKLALIDFQDARLGPPHYDLASLLYDPYAPVSDEERKQLLKSYRDTLQEFSVASKVDWQKLEPQIEQVGFQRMVKAAGSFASFFTRYGKRTHLPYLRPAIDTALRLVDNGSVPRELKEALELPKIREAIEAWT